MRDLCPGSNEFTLVFSLSPLSIFYVQISCVVLFSDADSNFAFVTRATCCYLFG